MKKNLLLMVWSLVLYTSTFAQISNNDDYVNLYQVNENYPGFISYTYRGLHPVGHAQFKMFNYGGTPNARTTLGANETLGSYVFNGYDGSQNVISAVIQAKTITDSRDPRFNFLLSNGIGNQRPNRMTIIGQTGNVGIGISDPTERLDVNGNIRMRGGAMAGYIPVSDADGVMTWTDPSILTSDSWTEASGEVYRPTGNVGIGGNPAARLHIRADGTGISDGIRITSSVNISEDWYAYIDSNDNFTFQDDGVSTMTLQNATGNVGIGTATPSTKVHIDGTGSKLLVGENSGILSKLTVNAETGTEIARFRLDGTTQMIINENGNIGMGTNTPGFTLDVKHSSIPPSVAGGDGLTIRSGDLDSWTIYALIGGSLRLYKGEDLKGGFSGTSGSYTTASDRRLKTNITGIEDNIIEKINLLKPARYHFKNNVSGEKEYGLIAQEVQKIFPKLSPVLESKEEGVKMDLLGVSYTEFVPILIKGIQEQQEVIEIQVDKIERLELELESTKNHMQSQIDQLTQKFEQVEKVLGSCCFDDNQEHNETMTTIELSNNTEQAILEQNTPNPFNAQTEIRYYIPSLATKGQMMITDNRGALLKTINLSGTGFGTVFVKAGELAPGTYFYTLVVDGNKVATKQMILVR